MAANEIKCFLESLATRDRKTNEKLFKMFSPNLFIYYRLKMSPNLLKMCIIFSFNNGIVDIVKHYFESDFWE